MIEDARGGIDLQGPAHHLPRVDAGLRDRAAEHILHGDDPVLGVEKENAEHLVLALRVTAPQVAPHDIRCVEQRAGDLAAQVLMRRLQHLVARCLAICAIRFLNEDRGSESGLVEIHHAVHPCSRAGLPMPDASRRSAALKGHRRPKAASDRPEGQGVPPLNARPV